MDLPTAAVTAADVKTATRRLGADLVGIVSCRRLEENPPDPTVPQVPSRVMPTARSAICIAKRTPWGEFLSDDRACVALTNQLVMRRLEKIALDLAYWLEEQGHPSLVHANEETDPELKRGSYGFLSLRHVAVEAGLGTFGLEVNLLTPEFGPRVYFTLLLTEAELESDERITQQLCIGPTCSRCLYACPTDAVRHWDIDKRQCAKSAQPGGVAAIMAGPLRALAHMESIRDLPAVMQDPDTWIKWAAVVRLASSYATCPRCVEVCPVGADYMRYLAREHTRIPEKTPAKVALARSMAAAEKSGQRLNNNPINVRWLGEDGYIPPAQRSEGKGTTR